MNKFQLFSLVAFTSLALPSCMTTYDRSGRPVQSIDPGLAAVGIIGAGLLGAAIASNNDDNNNDRSYHRPHRDYRRDYHHKPAPCHTSRGHGGHRRR